MKESTPPPLKERKEIRKETLKQLQQHRADTRERELVDCQAPPYRQKNKIEALDARLQTLVVPVNVDVIVDVIVHIKVSM